MLNFALGKIGGTKLGADYYWSSSEHSNDYAWYLRFSNGYVDWSDKDANNFYVRPVMQY